VNATDSADDKGVGGERIDEPPQRRARRAARLVGWSVFLGDIIVARASLPVAGELMKSYGRGRTVLLSAGSDRHCSSSLKCFVFNSQPNLFQHLCTSYCPPPLFLPFCLSFPQCRWALPRSSPEMERRATCCMATALANLPHAPAWRHTATKLAAKFRLSL